MPEPKLSVAAEKPETPPQAIIIDLGKQKRKKVKQLRKGRGELLDAIQAKVAELQTQGTLPKGVPPIIVLVGKKAAAARQRLF